MQCKKFWFHNGRLIWGCTEDIDPDGMEGKEWCRIDKANSRDAETDKDWDYCFPDIDFNQVR